MSLPSCTGARIIFSMTVLCGNRLNCWNTMPIFWRTVLISTLLPSSPRFLVMSMPSNTTTPSVGSSSRLSERKNVLLPPPDGPMTTTTSPLWISVSIPSSAFMTPLL